MTPEKAKGISSRSGPLSRVGRLRLCFSDLGADAFLVSRLPNVQYLCGFSGSAGVLVVEADSSTLFTDSRYTFQAQEEAVDAKVHIARGSLLRAAAEFLKARGGRRRVAYSAGHITVVQKRLLDDCVGKQLRWVNDGDSAERLRMVKDADELAIMRKAAGIISEVFRDCLPLIRPGMSELDLAAEIEHGIKRRGGNGPSFETIVASGAHSAWAHARPASNPMKKNDLVVLDQGAILRGYCSDMTRTVFLGRASRRVRGLYGAVLEAQEAAKAVIRPGVKAGDVDRAARSVLKGRKLARYFTHSTGHGLGLEVHEAPRLGKGEETLLQEGMVVTVEPGIYLEGIGGIRIEDDVLVTARGASDLTTATRDFLEL